MLTNGALWQLPAEGLFLYILLITCDTNEEAKLLRTGGRLRLYTILIVDDEPIVREGIRNRIQWAEHGFECIGDCEIGRAHV